MPITMLDPKTALIVIDLQKGIVAYDTTPPAARVVKHAVDLAQAFRRKGLPVVLVNVDGGAPGRTDAPSRGPFPAGFADIVPDLGPEPSDRLITKRTWGAFTGTTLDADLKQFGVTQIVLCGIATSIGVESTARTSYELGYNVTMATDAMADMNADAHTNSVTRIFPRLGECGTTQDVIARLG